MKRGLMSVFSGERAGREGFFLTLVAVSGWKASSYRTIERDRGVRESAYLNRIIPSNGRFVPERGNSPSLPPSRPFPAPLMLSKEERSLIKVTRMCSACASLA